MRRTRPPPFAGQGLNMGMRDAANLSFKLHLVLTGKAPDALLDTYEAERKPPSKATIRGSVRNGRLIQTANPFRQWLRDALFFLARRSPRVKARFMAAGFRKPPYREGFIGDSDAAGAPFVRERDGQDRARPDPPGRRALLETSRSSSKD